MNAEAFLTFCKGRYDSDGIAIFRKALELSKKFLDHRKRLSGDSYFDRNIRVAEILVRNKVAPEIVTGGILHGILQYTSEEYIKKNFSEESLELIQGVDEIAQIKSRGPTLEAEAIRKILLTTLRDVRVIFIKLATKLDSLRTIDVFPEKEQREIANETLEVYAPLAYRLGMDKIRVLLEDESFKIINPRKYHEIVEYIEDSREQREMDILNTIKLIRGMAKSNVDIVRIKGRPKHVYSIYKKILQGKNLRQLFDLLGIRVIVPEVKDCYTLLGLLHEQFDPLANRLKDYISNPKPNFYRSLHTGVRLSNSKIAEIQIRTPEMDEFAEEGLAAHWRYKKVTSEDTFEKKISWLRSLLDRQKGKKEFMEAVKVDIFGDKIYCYTPKGDVKELPKGAKILDFAFAVHEEIGCHTVGGRINGKFVPLKTEINVGDIVEVVTNKNQRPRRSWLKIVVSAKSKQKIRKSLREHEKLPALHYNLIKPVLKKEQGILVQSEDFPSAVCILAKCCAPIPGNDIIGITKRKMISTHRKDCKNALKEEERWVAVQWKETFNQRIRFFVRSNERSGLLADLLNTIAVAGFSVNEAKAKLIDLGHSECSFLIIPKDLNHLKELVRRVSKVQGVQSIYFE